MLYQLATMPGDPGRPNEDYAGVLGNCAILLDGAGAPGDLPTGCIHGVPWFVRQLGARCLAYMVTGEPDEPLDGFLAAAISDIAGLHKDTCDLSIPGTPSSMVVMTRAGEQALDYLVLGDSALVLETSGGVRVVTDKRMEEVAPPEYRAMLALPTGTPEHQAARIAFVRKQQPLRNRPDGYPVASTDPQAACAALMGSIPAGDLRQVVLMSDGVTRFAEFGLGSWKDALNILTWHGPAWLFARIRRAEAEDPEGRKWPRAKRHDDMSAVYWDGRHSAPSVSDC